MGGAERNARKKRQAQLAARAASTRTPTRTPTGTPAGSTPARTAAPDRGKVVIGAVVVVLLVGAVLGWVIYRNNQKNATEGQTIAVAESDASYQSRRDEAVVVVGEDSAKVTLDVYEDFLCPACRDFEDRYGSDIEKQVAEGAVRVRYHMLPMLDERSDPAGYSTDSANAALCAADAGKFPEFHLSLFGAQPEEGARGWDDQQLIELGRGLGLTSPSFKSCVDGGEYDDLLATHFDEVRQTEYLQQDFDGQTSFATPTVAVGEKVVEPTDERWLEKLVEVG